MFANAYKLASEFTLPVIISVRYFDKRVECSIGAFVIVNDDGWIITVAHLFEVLFASQKQSTELAEYKYKFDAIEQDQGLTDKQKVNKKRSLQVNSRWITKHSFWWGADNIQVQQIKVLPEADIAIGKLEPFDKAMIKTYPVFKDPNKGMQHGTSLCKLGYPFHNIESTFNEDTNTFKLADHALPVPRFPIEGIYTRDIIAGKTKDNKNDIRFLETSSPGLRGQSGGSIVDKEGTVWAIQSHTCHLPLGFSPKIKKNGKEIEENQFLNVGRGIHSATIIPFLQNNGVTFNLSDY